MLHNRIQRMIVQLVEECLFKQVDSLPYPIVKNMAIYFILEVSCHNHGYEKDSGSKKHPEWERHYTTYTHIVVTAQHRTYLHTCQGGRTLLEGPDASVFENKSNHHSEWKGCIGDRLFNEYMAAADYCYPDTLPKHEQVIPAHAGVEIAFDFFGPPFRFVSVEREPLPNNKESNHGYFDKLKSIKKLEWKIDFEIKEPA